MTLLLGFPQIFVAYIDNEEWIPLFDAAVLRAHWYILLGSTIAEITRETFKLLEKRYNRTVMLTTIGANAASALLVFWWFTAEGMINPEFQQKMASLFAGEADFVANIVMNFQYSIPILITVALIIDTVETVVRTLRK